MKPYGDRAFVITPRDPCLVAEAARSVTGVVDAVPGAQDLVVVCARPELVPSIARLVESLEPPFRPPDAEPVTVPVRYDGADLDEVSRLTGLDRREVIRRHSAATYRVAFMGFAPGFAYLGGLDPALAAVGRRAEPRPRVPAGSVALAGGWTGIYPASSPGGWHLLGTTTAVLWDLARRPPAVLRPGVALRFEPA